MMWTSRLPGPDRSGAGGGGLLTRGDDDPRRGNRGTDLGGGGQPSPATDQRMSRPSARRPYCIYWCVSVLRAALYRVTSPTVTRVARRGRHVETLIGTARACRGPRVTCRAPARVPAAAGGTERARRFVVSDCAPHHEIKPFVTTRV